MLIPQGKVRGLIREISVLICHSVLPEEHPLLLEHTMQSPIPLNKEPGAYLLHLP
jgi:hypothetical protein